MGLEPITSSLRTGPENALKPFSHGDSSAGLGEARRALVQDDTPSHLTPWGRPDPQLARIARWADEDN